MIHFGPSTNRFPGKSKDKMIEKNAVISDIHGNIWALRAVLADIEKRGAASVFNLGDSLYGPLAPAETADLLMREKITSISGNEDRIILEIEAGASPQPRFAHTMAQMNPRILTWLRSLQPTLRVSGFFLCHGLPGRDDEYLLEKATADGAGLRSPLELEALLAFLQDGIVLCGHSHMPRLTRISGGITIVNPGSAGLPAYRDDKPFPHAMEAGSPHARYAWVERCGNEWRIEHVAVVYDWRAAAACAAKNGRRDWEQWLNFGRV